MVKKVTISMPEETYVVLKERAKKSGMTFSKFMLYCGEQITKFVFKPILKKS